ncbi:MAG: hypothetical protein JXB15_17770 [Anaerolineales bacterium]|nr:hypothetical protein [Anaerolineales bacterium]
MDALLQLMIGLILLAAAIAAIVWINTRQSADEIPPAQPTSRPPKPEPSLNAPAPAELTQQIGELLRQGQKIEAIRVYRQATQAGLKACKDAVEAFERGEPLMIPPAPPARPTAAGGMSEVAEHLRQGNKLEAIKAYILATGAGLKEAKDAVEALERGEQQPVILPASMPAPGEDWLAQVKEHLRQGQKIAAVKLYRQATGAGLREAKDAIDAMEHER